MTVEIEIKPGSRGQWVVSKYHDGKLVDSDKVDPNNKKQRLALSRAFGVKDSDLLGWLDAGAGRHTIQDEPTVRTELTIREVTQKREQGTTTDFDAIITEHGLDTIATTELLDWSDKDKLCVLDIDYHEGTPPGKEALHTWMLMKLAPRPIAWHFSRSGGIHAFYIAADPYTAEELAAIAALRYRTIDAAAGVELKSVVRGPGPERVHWALTQDTTASLSAWLADGPTDVQAVQDYCDTHGLEFGRRYNHDKCPRMPSTDEGKHRQPVLVSDTGVYCFVCEGAGRTLGSRKPGFFPWAAVLDTPGQSDVVQMIRNLTHYGHAGWVLREKYGLPDNLARLAYRAACKAHHDGKAGAALVPFIFNEHTADMARIDDGWRTVDGYTYPKDIQPLLGTLPVCNYVTEDGIKTSHAAVCAMQQATDLTRYGYPSIEIVHGFKLSSVYLPTPKKTLIGRPHIELLKAGDRYLPRYIPKTKRMKEEAAWNIIEQIFPKIDRRFVKYSIIAMASAQETRLGMQPITFTSGSTGAGKSSTVRVAAAIIGAGTAEIVHQNDDVRYRAAVKQGKQRAAALLFDEVLKEASRDRNTRSVRNALDFFLTLTPDAMSHTLHVGPERMGRLPACFLSEPAPPNGMREEAQLARRMRHIRLDGYKGDWKDKWAAVGLSGQELFKLRTVSIEVADACNAIMSEVIDEFFSSPLTFDAAADRLQVFSFLDDPEFDDPTNFLLDFFRLVCDAPDLTNDREKKLYSRGYKKISKMDEDTDLVSVYSMFADGPPGTPEWLESRKLRERDWSGLLKSDHHVRFELKTNGVSVYVRFAVGPTKNPRLVNSEILG